LTKEIKIIKNGDQFEINQGIVRRYFHLSLLLNE